MERSSPCEGAGTSLTRLVQSLSLFQVPSALFRFFSLGPSIQSMQLSQFKLFRSGPSDQLKSLSLVQIPQFRSDPLFRSGLSVQIIGSQVLHTIKSQVQFKFLSSDQVQFRSLLSPDQIPQSSSDPSIKYRSHSPVQVPRSSHHTCKEKKILPLQVINLRKNRQRFTLKNQVFVYNY